MTGVFPKKRRGDQSVGVVAGKVPGAGCERRGCSAKEQPRGARYGYFFFLSPVVRIKWGVSYCASSPAANDGRLAYGRALEAN